MKIQRLWSSIYMRMFALFLAVLLIASAFSLAFVKSSRSSLEREIGRTTVSTIQHLLSNFNSQISNIQQDLLDLVNDSGTEVRNFAANYNTSSESHKNWIRLRSILKAIQKIQKSNPLVQEVMICYPYLKVSLSSEKSILVDITDEVSDEVEQYRSMQPFILTYDSLTLASYYPAHIQSGHLPSIYIKAILSDKKILQQLLSISSYTGYDVAFLSPDTGKMISTEPIEQNQSELLALLEKILSRDVPFSKDYDDFEYDDIPQYHGIMFRYNAQTSCCMVYSNELNAAVFVFLPLRDIYSVPLKMQNFLLLFLLIFVPLTLFLFAILNTSWLKRPIDVLLKGCDDVANHRYHKIAPPKGTSDELANLIGHFNNMAEKQEELINMVLLQDLYAKESELKQLQAQINPHFLYNSFYMLRHMISDEDIESAEKLSDFLGQYFKYITDYLRQDASLLEEYNHAVTYLQIQEMRFFKRLTMDIAPLPEALSGFRVPRLILQPLFENAIVHGIKVKTTGALIRLNIWNTEEDIFLSVEDNGESLTDEMIESLNCSFCSEISPEQLSGLVNIHHRLQLRFGSSCGLKAERSPLGGLCITEHLSIHYGNTLKGEN